MDNVYNHYFWDLKCMQICRGIHLYQGTPLAPYSVTNILPFSCDVYYHRCLCLYRSYSDIINLRPRRHGFTCRTKRKGHTNAYSFLWWSNGTLTFGVVCSLEIFQQNQHANTGFTGLIWLHLDDLLVFSQVSGLLIVWAYCRNPSKLWL
jgi:hypothetical protein